MPAARTKRVYLGQIVAAHGIRGRVRIRPFTAEPGGVAAYGPVVTDDGRTLELSAVEPAGRGLITARIAGVQDRNAAETLRGQRFFVPRERMPPPDAPDEYYMSDLVGLEAATAEGRPLGSVVAVHDFGAGPLLELGGAAGGGRFVPFTREVVPTVDLAAGRLTIAPPPGLLEEGLPDEAEAP